MKYLQILKEQFGKQIDIREVRPGVRQLLMPYYYEDGDIIEIFIEENKLNNDNEEIRICDYGMALMHLSYYYELDTENKKRIFRQIIFENGVNVEDGNIFIDSNINSIYPVIMQSVNTITKISNMKVFKREVIKSLFYEMLADYINENLISYHPQPKYYPIPERTELVVDYAFNNKHKPIYLFGVKDNTKARLTTISCLEFIRSSMQFKSVAVHEDFENISSNDRKRLTSAVDKQFVSLDDFTEHSIRYFSREME